MTTTRSRDGCVVPTDQLAPILSSYVTDWNRRHPVSAGRFAQKTRSTRVTQGRVAVKMVGAVESLSEETGVPKATINNILSRRNRHTELRIADELVSKIGRPEMWHDGTLSVVPNLNATRAARAACCSGSEQPQTLLGA